MTYNKLYDDSDSKYCGKCFLKRRTELGISHVKIFNIVNDIIFNSSSMPEVYERMEKIKKLQFDKWLELNDNGSSVFHWFVWYISNMIKKYKSFRSKVYAFFQKVLGDNTIKSIFKPKQINMIVTLTNPYKPNNTILYHMVRYCENNDDMYYKRLYNLLLERGSPDLTVDQLSEIASLNVGEESLPDELRCHISEITNTYKHAEELIIKYINEKCNDLKLNKCIDCNSLIDYTKDLPKIIEYAKINNIIYIIDLIRHAYCQRKLLNKIFNNYYDITNSHSKLNMIHKRHSYVLNIYTEILEPSN